MPLLSPFAMAPLSMSPTRSWMKQDYPRKRGCRQTFCPQPDRTRAEQEQGGNRRNRNPAFTSRTIQQQLLEAVAKEEYEKAAKIRDEM